ncbi:hypothetical protein [Rhizobium alvei]|uniref:DUF883 domain-containing protein n=1 Tax=Rhizobium alvei TaxID=1132659 RepID=A0ABT8YJA4_9HYPH|nr:hypothetical protein [Rhizobium alvei]MDO6963532.1 hypothetical protein [Rhizobium alvei]
MAGIETIRTEIDAILKELEAAQTRAQASSKPESDGAKPDESGPPIDIASAIEALGELRDQLEKAAGEAGDAITEHPIAATAAAFLLGLIIGRISKGL